jgi:predicted RNase H-like HicB family nuclease
MRYPIVIEAGDQRTAYSVIVPDLPGCFSAGDTLEEAIANAEEAISLYLEDYLDEGRAPPKVSSIEALKATGEYADMTWALVPVDLSKSSSKSVRVNVTIPDRILSSIDSYAIKRGESRSGFLTRAALEAMTSDGK